jgi:hypothetical protein
MRPAELQVGRIRCHGDGKPSPPFVLVLLEQRDEQPPDLDLGARAADLTDPAVVRLLLDAAEECP